MASQNPGGGGGGSSDGDYGWGPPTQQQHAQYTPIRNAHHAHHHGHGQSPAQPGVPDMPVVLLALADTYITAAHANGYRVSFGTASDTEAYYKLVATGLACLETALQVGHCAMGGEGAVRGEMLTTWGTVSATATR